MSVDGDHAPRLGDEQRHCDPATSGACAFVGEGPTAEPPPTAFQAAWNRCSLLIRAVFGDRVPSDAADTPSFGAPMGRLPATPGTASLVLTEVRAGPRRGERCQDVVAELPLGRCLEVVAEDALAKLSRSARSAPAMCHRQVVE